MTEETPPVEIHIQPTPKTGIEALDLFPLTFSREAALNAMGIQYGYVPPEKLKKIEGIFRYDGDLGDTIKTLWMCSIPNKSEIMVPSNAAPQERRDILSAWSVQRAEKMPDEAYERAQEWAQETLGIKDDKGKEFVDAYIHFLILMKKKDDANFIVKVDGESGAPSHAEDPDPND